MEYLIWAQGVQSGLNIGKELLSDLTGIRLEVLIDHVGGAAQSEPVTDQNDSKVVSE